MPGDRIEEVVAALEVGGVVVLPTDTVYGLVALASDPAATAALFAIKGRSADVPLAVLCASVEDALALAAPSLDAPVAAVAAKWWPGPLTLVLPRRAGVELHLGEPSDTVGVRVPDHELVRAIAARVGPLAATSANRHGEPVAETATAAGVALEGVALIVDGGSLEASSSTVVDATTWPWTVLRAGPVDGAAILAVAAAALEPRG